MRAFEDFVGMAERDEKRHIWETHTAMIKRAILFIQAIAAVKRQRFQKKFRAEKNCLCFK